MPAENLRWLLRPLAAVAALAAAVGAQGVAREDTRDRRDLLTRAAELGIGGKPLAELSAALRREADPSERRIRLARHLQSSREPPPLDSAERRLRRLDVAETLARQALSGLPASWEAASLLGIARFERRLLRRDPGRHDAESEWEDPLLAAVARADGSPTVEKILAAAYLEAWPELAPAKRQQVAELLRRSLDDRRFYLTHLARWVEVAGSFEQAEWLLRQDAETARLLADLALRIGAREAAVRYELLARDRLRGEYGGWIESALAAREPTRSWYFYTIVENAPLGLDFVPLVERSLRERSPSQAGLSLPQAAERWLLWAEPLCLIGDCPFTPAAFDLLLALAATRIGSPNAAFATLAAGDTRKAERLASRADALWSEEWAPYLLLAAKRRLADGDTVTARALLATLHRSARTRPSYARLLRDLGGSGIRNGPADGVRPLAREEWGLTDWRGDDQSRELELGVERSAAGISVRFRSPVASDLLLTAELDGEVANPVPLSAGMQEIRLPAAVVPGVHVLRLRPKGGGLPEVVATRLE